MMNYLKEIGISDEKFEEIKKINGEGALSDLYFRRNEAFKIIQYLREIHINNVEDILKYVIDVFFKDYEEIKSKFEKYGIDDAVKNINIDVYFIEKVVLN